MLLLLLLLLLLLPLLFLLLMLKLGLNAKRPARLPNTPWMYYDQCARDCATQSHEITRCDLLLKGAQVYSISEK